MRLISELFLVGYSMTEMVLKDILSFTKENCQNDIENGMSLEQIYKKYNKNKSTGKYWIKKWGLKSNFKNFANGYNGEKATDPESGFQICTTCNINKPLNEYGIRSERNGIHRRSCKECQSIETLKRIENARNKVSELLGKNCMICGTSGHYSIFDVHHVLSSKKKFGITSYCRKDLQPLIDEIDNCKCILLCCNCHRETHGGLHPEYLEEIKELKREEVELNIESKKCNECGKVFRKEHFHIEHQHGTCKVCFNNKERSKREHVTQQCIDYLNPEGKCCTKCGYNKYNGALDFHHKNPNEKDFMISEIRHKYINKKHKKELDKCELLCGNCHRLEHYYNDNTELRSESSLDNEMSDLNIGTDFGVEESKEED